MMIFQTDLRAFHGKQEVKDFYLARVRAHAVADELVHGVYWQNGKGCAVGCTVHSGDHAAYEKELGIPRVLARLEDGIFESLLNGRSKLWPEQFLRAPRVGADLSLIWPRFAVWLLVDSEHGVIQFSRSERSRKSIQAVADAYQKVINGDADQINWMNLRYAAAAAADAAAAVYAAADAADAAAAAADAADDAAAAAAAAADAADDAAAADAADDAAAAAVYAAAADAADAAVYAADAAAAAAARQKFRNAQADKLIELMEAAL